jgi:cell division protein FtsL
MKLTRVINVLAVLLVIGAAATVYRIKYQAVRQTVEIEQLNHAIAREKSAITVLEAEWAHLARPDRVQALAEKHLDLTSVDPHQRVAIADLPMRPVRVDSIAETIASLGAADTPIHESKPSGEDLIGRTIESMGLAVPAPDSVPFGYPQ